MIPSLIRALAAWALLLSIAIAGCASAPPAADRPAASAPALPVAEFSAARRCMDTLLLDYGARDLAIAVDDLTGAATKDLLLATLSEMTQRSRAIRAVAAGNVAGQRPQYALRGSVAQADQGAAAVDLTLLSAQDMSAVPGVAARAEVARTAGGAEIRKFGLAFGVAGDRAQTLRSLVDVAAIELVGRLAKVPYWTCFGTAESHPQAASEIQDWYDTMAARPAELIRYFQGQLRQRRIYDGPVDGAVNAELKDAVSRYREALGLSREPKLSLDLYRAYLAADHARLESRLAAAVPKPAAKVDAAPVPAPAALALQISAADDARRFGRGEAIRLAIRPSRDAHVYCFLQDENRSISRFFPNRFQRDSRVPAAEGLQLPGAMRFEIRMNAKGVPETVACFATERDVLTQLPADVKAADFAALPVASIDDLRNAFAKAAGGALAYESFALQPR